MPAIAPLSMTDGTTSVTLNPSNRANGMQEYRQSGATSISTAVKLKFNSTQQQNAQRQYVRLVVPVVVTDSTTGEEIVRENAVVELSARWPSLMETSDRETAAKQFSDLLANGLATEFHLGEGQW